MTRNEKINKIAETQIAISRHFYIYHKGNSYFYFTNLEIEIKTDEFPHYFESKENIKDLLKNYLEELNNEQLNKLYLKII